MPNSCCAVGCSNHGMMKRKISFFTFPSDQERRSKWISAVKRINADGSKWLPGKYTVLCSDHFIEGIFLVVCLILYATCIIFKDVSVKKSNNGSLKLITKDKWLCFKRVKFHPVDVNFSTFFNNANQYIYI
jgi:hypothetical protein